VSEHIFDRVVGIGSGLLGAALIVAATVHLRAPLPVPVMPAAPAAPAAPVAVAVAPAAATAQPLIVLAVLRPHSTATPLGAHNARTGAMKPRAGVLSRPAASPAAKRQPAPPLRGSVTSRLALLPAVHPAVALRVAPSVHAAPLAHLAPARTVALPAPLPAWYHPPARSAAHAHPARNRGATTPAPANALVPQPPVGYDPAPSLATTTVDTAAATAVSEPAPNASALPIFAVKRGR